MLTRRCAARAIVLCLAAGLPGGAAKADELLVGSYNSATVGRFDLNTGAGLGVLPNAPQGPQCMAIGPDGKLYVATEIENCVLRYDAQTYAFIDTFVGVGSGGLNGPNGIAWDRDNNLLVCSFNSDEVLKYNGQTGAAMGAFVTAGSGGLNGPDNGLTFGPDGNLYVPSFWGNAVLKFDGQTGASLGVFVS